MALDRRDPDRPSLIVADDHRMVAEALCLVLESEFQIVGRAFSGMELVALLERQSAHCLLLDLLLPGVNGLELVPQALALRPSMRILVFTMLDDRPMARAALDAGAHGFVPKDASIQELKHALGEVLAGRRYVSQRVPKSSHHGPTRADLRGLEQLTPRQQQVFSLMGEGRSESEIAHAMGLGLSTVSFHKRKLMQKLGVNSEASLRRLCVLMRAEYAEPRAPDPTPSAPSRRASDG